MRNADRTFSISKFDHIWPEARIWLALDFRKVYFMMKAMAKESGGSSAVEVMRKAHSSRFVTLFLGWNIAIRKTQGLRTSSSR